MNNNEIYPFSPELNSILKNLCQDIETPNRRDLDNTHEKERLLEYIENQSYPYPLLQCDHQEQMKIGEDCVDCQIKQYNTYRDRFFLLTKEKGYEDTHTLKSAFDYYSTLITQYRLKECNELLDLIYPYCIARGNWSTYYIMAIQARAFLRFKQKRYEEAIDYFNMQIEALGPNELIYENMALAYARLNQPIDASKCYAEAILLIRQKPLEEQQFATLFISLSLVLEKIEDAFTVLNAGMELLKIKYKNKPHSLMAKTLTAMGDLHTKKHNALSAEKCYSEAVQIFIDTCGYNTPLTSSAMNKHAGSLILLNNKDKAAEIYLTALSIWVKLDDEIFDIQMILEAILFFIKDKELSKIHSEKLFTTLQLLQNKIVNSPIFSADLNAICLLKFIYELFILQGNIPAAMACCKAFENSLFQLKETDLLELTPYRDQLLEETRNLLKIMASIK